MHKGCKGCRDENTLCSKQYIKPVCPCVDCLIKPMCTLSCEILKEFVAKNIDKLRLANSRIKKGKLL